MYKILQSQSYMRDPGPFLAQFREQGPLVRTRIPIMGNVWVTTTQAATAHVLKDSSNFTVRKSNGKVVGMAWWMPRSIQLLASNMLASDDPDHKRLRGTVDQAFNRREILSLDEDIQNIATQLSANLFSKSGPVDLIAGFARPFPLAVICELLGLPQEDRPRFMQWAGNLTRVSGIFTFFLAINKLKPMTRYIRQRTEIARNEGGTGLIRELVKLQGENGLLSDDELIAMVFLLLVAGHETTTHLISGGILALIQHPEQLSKLLGDWSQLDMAVEEILRFVSPVQSTKPRFVQEDCVVEGVQLKAGEIIMPLLIAANRDPEVFDEPDHFNISRRPNRHMEFGTGVHFCLGHQLARLEMKQALKTLLTDYPDLNLAVPDSDIMWNERFGLRALKTLPVKA
ncbi:MAG: cytochrome P450 family protein [Rhizobiaceae bacterium]